MGGFAFTPLTKSLGTPPPPVQIATHTPAKKSPKTLDTVTSKMEIANPPLDIQQLIWEAFVSALHERMGQTLTTPRQTIFGTRTKTRAQTADEQTTRHVFFLPAEPHAPVSAPGITEPPMAASSANGTLIVVTSHPHP